MNPDKTTAADALKVARFILETAIQETAAVELSAVELKRDAQAGPVYHHAAQLAVRCRAIRNLLEDVGEQIRAAAGVPDPADVLDPRD